jgi:hypothetical protein
MALDELESPLVKEVRRELNRLRGQLAGLIEASDLPLKQERGLVSVMKTLSYDAEAAIVKHIKSDV